VQNGLSQKQVIAISVGISVFVLLMVLFIAIFIIKRRKAKKIEAGFITEDDAYKTVPWWKKLLGGGKGKKKKGTFVEVSQKEPHMAETAKSGDQAPNAHGEAAGYYDAPAAGGLGLPEALKTRPMVQYETPYYESPDAVGVGLPKGLKKPDPYVEPHGAVSAESSIYDGREGVKPSPMY